MKNLIYFPLLCLFFFSCTEKSLETPGALVPLTVTEDATLPSILVNNVLLHSETFGDRNNPMIIVIHGGPGADYRSILNCKDLAQDSFFVVFYDQRGSGLSQRQDASVYTTQLFIDDLDAVINHYHQNADQKIILMGHSWGAMLATAYVNDFPDRISGVVLMEPGGFTWEDTEDYVGRSQNLELFGESTNDLVYTDQLLTGADHTILDYRRSLVFASDLDENNVVGNAGLVPFWRPGAVCSMASFDYVKDQPFDFTTHLGQYSTKVLFAYSELNEAYGKAHAELLASAYPNVELVKINGTGHEIPHFGWADFYPIALAYLNEVR